MFQRLLSTCVECLRQFLLVFLAVITVGAGLAWGYVDEYAGRERVLMLGDSITIQQNTTVTPTARAIGWQVQEAFAGLANVHLISENFQDTDYALSEVSPGVSHIESWINHETWDVIDFNTGLHDMKVGQPQHDVPASYAAKLGQVIDEIKVHSGEATLIWRETTFVPNPEGSNRHKAVDGVTAMNNVQQYYNTAAAPVVAAKGITIVDAVDVPSRTAPRVAANNVHYTEAGYRQLAPTVIENVYNQLHIMPGMRVDFGVPDTSSDNVQDDYYDFKTINDVARFVATDLGTQNCVEVTVANVASNGSRDRGALGAAGTAQSDLLRDFVFAAQNSGPLEIVISGLKSGDYTFTGYFHDSNTFQGIANVDVSVDGGENFTDAMSVTYTTGSSPTSIGTGSFSFTSDGVNDVILNILADSTAGGNGSAVLNGFEIVAAVPETSMIVSLLVMLLIISSVVIARYRRRIRTSAKAEMRLF